MAVNATSAMVRFPILNSFPAWMISRCRAGSFRSRRAKRLKAAPAAEQSILRPFRQLHQPQPPLMIVCFSKRNDMVSQSISKSFFT
jgi:hypothetical protein